MDLRVAKKILDNFEKMNEIMTLREISTLCKCGMTCLEDFIKGYRGKMPTTKTYFNIIFGLGLSVTVYTETEKKSFNNYKDFAEYLFGKVLSRKNIFDFFVHIRKRINPSQYKKLPTGEYSLDFKRFNDMLSFNGIRYEIE